MFESLHSTLVFLLIFVGGVQGTSAAQIYRRWYNDLYLDVDYNANESILII